ncbi:MAG: carboxymuconolactone decarboxylase family protein [Actinomycetota bacterium]|nr:carboxymuconolactone decarboxylase family protein [Actinomycetota bacterium]
MSITVAEPQVVVDLIDSSQAPLLARPYYQGSDPGPIVAALAHVPEVLEVAMPFISALYGPSALPVRLKEIVVVRTSAHLECRYCIESHSVVALDAGFSCSEILGLRDLDDTVRERWSSDEAGEPALMEWIDAVAGATGSVSKDSAGRMREYFSDAEIVELTLLISATMMLNRFCTALGLPSSNGTLERLRAEDLL